MRRSRPPEDPSLQDYNRLGMRMAPSSLTTTPFSIEFSIPCRTSSANSSGFPARLGNSMTRSSDFRALSLIIDVIRDSKSEGAIVTTRTPYCARSRASGRVRERIAPLLAAYETLIPTWSQLTPDMVYLVGLLTCPGWPSYAADEDTKMMTPRSPSGPYRSVVVMCGRHWRTRSSVPLRLMFRTKSIEDKERGSLLRSMICEPSHKSDSKETVCGEGREKKGCYRRLTFPGFPTPAALITPPIALPVSLTHATTPLIADSMLSVSLTSASKKRARCVPNSLTILSPEAVSRSSSAIYPPCACRF